MHAVLNTVDRQEDPISGIDYEPQKLDIRRVLLGDTNKETLVVVQSLRIGTKCRRRQLIRIFGTLLSGGLQLTLKLTSYHDAPLAPILERDQAAHLNRLSGFVDDDRFKRVLRQRVLSCTRQGRTNYVRLV